MGKRDELYQELILDYSKRSQNYQKLSGADRTAKGYNPPTMIASRFTSNSIPSTQTTVASPVPTVPSTLPRRQ